MANYVVALRRDIAMSLSLPSARGHLGAFVLRRIGELIDSLEIGMAHM